MPDRREERDDSADSSGVETLTFLFTDIEGSTVLLQELGEDYNEILNAHHRLLREAFGKHGAIEVGTEGDAFFVAFRSVPDAVNAAAEAQRALNEYDWGDGVTVSVRMGMHTGDALKVGDNYGGIDVHRAARIASAGHGGQVLLSAVSAGHAQASPRLFAGIGFRELGEFHLKDLKEPERLFQMVFDGLPNDFPPPRTLDRPLVVPDFPGTFVPRDRELQQATELLSRNRLVTLTGPGGTGKTRLGVEVARANCADFRDGTFFVALGSVEDPQLVPGTIAETLRVREVGTKPMIEVLKGFLENKNALLALDNFEHVLSAAPVVADLLESAPALKVLVTSRSPLHLSGEQEFPIPPMTVPSLRRSESAETLRTYEAVRLFEERARAVRPDFSVNQGNAQVISQIANRLDGLPLAIELAAARMRLLTPDDLAKRLDDALALLSSRARDRPERQQTLRNAIQWSYGLLSDDNKRLFRTLGVFSGGWTWAAVDEICGLGPSDQDLLFDGLETLVDSSLVVMREDEATKESRFFMLQTIREFAIECLGEHGEIEEFQQRHARYFMTIAQEAEPRLLTDPDLSDRLETEHDNLRAALRWAIEHNDAGMGLILGASLWRFWQTRSHLAEGRRFLKEVLDLVGSRDLPELRGKALNAIGGVTYWQNDYEATRRHYQEALDTNTSINHPAGMAESTYNLGFIYLIKRDLEPARELFERSLKAYTELEDELNAAFSKWGLSMTYIQSRGMDEARRFAEEALATFERLNNWFGISLGHFVFYQIERLTGNHAKAREIMLADLLAAGSDRDVSLLPSAIELFAENEIVMGYPERGMQLMGAAKNLRDDYGGGAPPPLLELATEGDLARNVLSDQDIQAALERGKRMSIDEVLAFARKDPDA